MHPGNRLLFSAALAVPLGLLALAGWANFRQAESEASRRAAQGAEALSEHALRTVRTHELILDFVDHQVQGMRWPDIAASPQVHRLLRHLTEKKREVASVFLMGPDGVSWASSRAFPMPRIDAADRDYFQALQREAGLFISRPATGRLANDRYFAVARRKSSLGGGFDGLIAVSVDPSYFETFYAGLLEPTQAASLVRADGAVLARNPAMKEVVESLPPDSGFMRAIARQPQYGVYRTRSLADGVERLIAYRRVGDYPLYASFQMSLSAIWEAWWWAMLPYALATVLAMALMMASIGLAAQHARRLAAEARSQEAERASRAKDAFLAALSHELRNPLAAISNAAQALVRAGRLAAAERTAAEIIARQIGMLRTLLDDLLDTARAVHGKLRLDKRRIDLRQVAATVIAEQLEAYPGAHATLSVPGGEPWVDADPVRVKQMLDNLVENALKYGGRNIGVQIEAAGDWVQVAIRDDGQGIARELLPRLFEPFVQGEQTLDRAQGGLGLGLALVHRLAALHGGTLVADSAGPGQGSCFTLRLPRAEAPARAVALAGLGGAQRSRRLLVVDDEADARESLCALLEMEGHQVTAAADGPAALAALARARPEIALVDIGLPGMDGYELARRAKAVARGVPLIAVTGYGQREDREQARAAGFDAHLTKPFSYEELLRAIDAVERRAAA